MKPRFLFLIALAFFSMQLVHSQSPGLNNNRHFLIKPSATDASITKMDAPHVIIYDSTSKQGKLLVFLPGTSGIPEKGPFVFFNTAVEQGYRVISLSYIDDPAVAQACIGGALKLYPACSAQFRSKRLYGKGSFPLIVDEPQDAIVNRLIKLLQYLALHNASANWGRYLENGSLKWGEIAFSGQSQGGGMAEFIGKHQLVYKIISFSGGWDWDIKKGHLANWYFGSNVTPADKWYGTYNTQEPAAEFLKEQYNAIKMPGSHLYALSLPVRPGKEAHPEGVSNPAYKSIWIEMLGRGN